MQEFYIIPIIYTQNIFILSSRAIWIKMSIVYAWGGTYFQEKLLLKMNFIICSFFSFYYMLAIFNETLNKVHSQTAKEKFVNI